MLMKKNRLMGLGLPIRPWRAELKRKVVRGGVGDKLVRGMDDKLRQEGTRCGSSKILPLST
jgi:hypothetical protein